MIKLKVYQIELQENYMEEHLFTFIKARNKKHAIKKFRSFSSAKIISITLEKGESIGKEIAS